MNNHETVNGTKQHKKCERNEVMDRTAREVAGHDTTDSRNQTEKRKQMRLIHIKLEWFLYNMFRNYDRF